MAPVQGYVSIGIDVKINNKSLNFVTNIGDVMAPPALKDTTSMRDTMKHSSLGVQDAGAFTVEFLYDNSDADSDFRVLAALKGQKNIPVVITYPDGTKFTSAGEVSVNVKSVGVDDVIGAVATIALSQDWEKTDPV